MSSTSDSEGEVNNTNGNIEDWTSEYLGDVDSIDGVQLTTDYEIESDIEFVNEFKSNEENVSDFDKNDKFYAYYINKFYSLFKFDSNFTLTNVLKFLSILILSILSFSLIEFIYYKYRIDNMIGTIDDLPKDPLFHELHQNKCNKVLNQYNNQLNNCFNKNNINYINCLNEFHKSISKNSNFCNWNIELLYSKNYAKIMLKESSSKFNTLINSINKFTKNELTPKLFDTYNNLISDLIKFEKKFVKFTSDFGKNYKLMSKFDNSLNDINKNLRQGSQIVYKFASEKTYGMVNKIGKLIEKYKKYYK